MTAASVLEAVRERWRAHALAGSLCLGLAAANAARCASVGLAATAVVCAAASALAPAPQRPALLGLALVLAGWWWGSARLDALDRSPLLDRVGRADVSLVAVTGPPSATPFQLRVPATLLRFGRERIRERVLLVLPLGAPPAQGALLEVLGTLALPRGPDHGFDERTYLRRHGVHVVLHGDRWRAVGRRGGLGGIGDRLRRWLATSIAGDLAGERRGLVEGVVLGDEQGLSPRLRDDFRASGLYHLLAVSGQNVAIVAGTVLAVAWLAGIPRVFAELGALLAIGAYVLAVGPQPSVVRAGVAGALGSLAWLAARPRDRWYFLLLGAIVLLGWNPYALLDAGFQLSFAAVAAIFAVYPRLARRLEGYPLPRGLREAVAVATACGLATAPVLWLQFHALPLLSVPANALAAPAVLPLLVLALAAAAVHPLWAPASTALAWLAGWCAAYLAACARVVAAAPFAQIRSPPGALALAAVALVVAAYAWRRRWRTT